MRPKHRNADQVILEHARDYAQGLPTSLDHRLKPGTGHVQRKIDAEHVLVADDADLHTVIDIKRGHQRNEGEWTYRVR